jgi:methyl-accepting chemotaxis protein
MDAVDAQYGGMLDSSGPWQTIKADWQNLGANVFDLTAPDSFARHTALTEKLLDLTIHVGAASSLVLDPDPDSYYLIDVAVNRLLFLVEHLGQLRGMATGIVARRQISEGDHILLSKLLGQIEMMQEGIQNSLEMAFKSNQSLKPVLGVRQDALAALAKAFLAVVEQLPRSEQVDPALSPSEFFTAGTRATEAGFGLYDAAMPALVGLLQNRVAGLNERKFTALGGVLACVVLALLLAYGITRAVVRSLRQARQVAGDLAVGELDNAITITGSDEIGQLLGALERVLN